MTIEQHMLSNHDALLNLNQKLFPDSILHEEDLAYRSFLDNPNHHCFIAKEQSNSIGFVHVSLRYDYVEGSDESPTAYLEAIYVSPENRGTGVAALLLAHAEAWALERGCTVLASDTELNNASGIQFHESHGFEEANRIICYTKKLDTQS